jgi:hypothetical protein
VVAVEAVDRATQTPIRGANVAMHPYRATTGADGVAHIHVSKGQYRVLISGPRHMPHQVDTEVTADTLIRAELDLDEAPADYSFWL